MKLTIKQIHILTYATILLMALVAAYIDYQRWLNPLGMNPEQNPKQHNGAQEFTPPVDFESSVQPGPNADGVTVYVPLEKLHDMAVDTDPTLSPEDQKIFDELKEKDDYQGEIYYEPQIIDQEEIYYKPYPN